MLIKRKKRFDHYLGWGAIVVLGLLGGYGLLLQHKPNATVIAEVHSDRSSHPITLRVDHGSGMKLAFTLFGDSSVVNRTQVAGANLSGATIAGPHKLPHYPSPVESKEFPKALVVALTYPWAPKPRAQQTQYTTFLLDSTPLPAVSLSGSPQHFFGKEGFYSIKSDQSKEVSHTIHVELIDTTTLRTSALAEATVAGISTKKLPMKSLDLNFDAPLYSNQVFGDTLATPLHSLRLRNAGNDFLLAYMRDAVVSALSQPTHALSLRYQPVVVFINGEFWGLQYLREHISEDNLRAKYPALERDQIRLGELHQNKVLVISNGFDYKLDRLMDFIGRADLNQPEYYDSLSRLLDLPNLIDYLAVQTFVNNSDWPHNNVKGVFLNNKLYFLLYDTDFAFAYPTHYQEQVGNYFDWPDRIHHVNAHTHNYFDSLDHYIPSQIGTIYHTLIEVPAFREQFIRRYRELLQGPLSQVRIQQVVSTIHDQLTPLMPQHIARWGYPASVDDWNQNVRHITEFCAYRRHYINDQLKALEDKAFPNPMAAD